MRSLGEVLQRIHESAPPETADSWDNVGLLLGDPKWQVQGAVICIDLTQEALEIAQKESFQLIVNHHPCLFPKGDGLKSFVPGHPGSLQERIFRAVEAKIGVIAAHTNFDQSSLEVVENVSKGLGFRAQGRFHEKDRLGRMKLGIDPQKIVSGQGYGVWGDFPKEIPFSELAQRVKKLFDLDGYWISQKPPEQVRRVGFVAGKGASFLDSAIENECDLFITGEAGYHNVLYGASHGTGVMEIGHRESEKFFLQVMEKWLRDLGLKTRILNTPTQAVIGKGN